MTSNLLCLCLSGNSVSLLLVAVLTVYYTTGSVCLASWKEVCMLAFHRGGSAFIENLAVDVQA